MLYKLTFSKFKASFIFEDRQIFHLNYFVALKVTHVYALF